MTERDNDDLVDAILRTRDVPGEISGFHSVSRYLSSALIYLSQISDLIRNLPRDASRQDFMRLVRSDQDASRIHGRNAFIDIFDDQHVFYC